MQGQVNQDRKLAAQRLNWALDFAQADFPEGLLERTQQKEQLHWFFRLGIEQTLVSFAMDVEFPEAVYVRQLSDEDLRQAHRQLGSYVEILSGLQGAQGLKQKLIDVSRPNNSSETLVLFVTTDLRFESFTISKSITTGIHASMVYYLPLISKITQLRRCALKQCGRLFFTEKKPRKETAENWTCSDAHRMRLHYVGRKAEDAARPRALPKKTRKKKAV